MEQTAAVFLSLGYADANFKETTLWRSSTGRHQAGNREEKYDIRATTDVLKNREKLRGREATKKGGAHPKENRPPSDGGAKRILAGGFAK